MHISPSLIMILVIGGTIFFLSGVLFYFLIFPIWMLIACATSKVLSNKAKAFWVVAMIFIWPLAGILFGLSRSNVRLVRRLSGVFVFLCVVGVALLIGFMPKINKFMHDATSQTIARLERVQMSNVSISDQGRLRTSLDQLQKETDQPWYALKQRQIAWQLFNLMDVMIGDSQLTSDEYVQWMGKFNSRSVLDYRMLEQQVRDLKKSSPRVQPDNGTLTPPQSNRQASTANANTFHLSQSRTDVDDKVIGAVGGGDVEGVKAALASGANPNALGPAKIPVLGLAATKGNLQVINALLDHGADINIRGLLGTTPLMMAIQQNKTDVVKLLISRGANVNIKNDMGGTALSMAKGHRNNEVLSLLKKVGANE